MNSQIKEQWLTALRSGEYTQGGGNLRSSKGYCCLGVLCDLYARETGTEWVVNHTLAALDETPVTYYTINHHSSFLPRSVVEWAGLSTGRITIESENSLNDLTHLNDSGTPFSQIAQLIEEQL